MNLPWMLIGDFNQVLYSKEKLSFSSMLQGVTAFENTVCESGMFELNSSGAYFTWTNNRKRENAAWEKIDRCLVNVI